MPEDSVDRGLMCRGQQLGLEISSDSWFWRQAPDDKEPGPTLTREGVRGALRTAGQASFIVVMACTASSDDPAKEREKVAQFRVCKQRSAERFPAVHLFRVIRHFIPVHDVV